MIREKEQYTNIKNKIEGINKEIMQIKSENNSIIVNTDKINATLTKKSNEYIKQVKAKMKKYEIEQIAFKKTDPTAGYIIAKYNIIPYGTLETINIIMGVV